MKARKPPVTADFGFRKRLGEVLEGNRVSYCYQCGACVGDCPSARYDPEFNPRRIMLEALYGLSDQLLGEESLLWRCSNCYTCAERCPQQVKPAEVIIAMKNLMLADEGRAPKNSETVVKSVLGTGRSTKITPVVEKRRDALGLPELTHPPAGELRALCGEHGFYECDRDEGESKTKHEEGGFAFFPGCMIPVKYPQMEAAIRRTLPRLGVELHDLDSFSCCPDPIFFKASDKLEWLSIAGRNLAVAEEAGLDIFTICSGCTATLSEAYHLLQDEETRERVNARLARIGRRYEGKARVRHLATLIRDDVGLDKVASTVVKPLEGLKVAAHYGCHLLKPSKVMQVDDPDDPSVLDDLLACLGVDVVKHHDRLLCCGRACQDCGIPDEMLGNLLDSAQQVEADCLGVICPSCFDEFDMGQIQLARRTDRESLLPAVYYFQLLALAQGDDPKDVGLDRHRIKPEAILKA